MRPGPPAGRGGWGRGRRQEERGGSRGAETAARGGFCGRGRRRRRLGVPSARGRARERDAGGCGGGGGGRDRSGGGRARRKPQSAGGPVAGSGREPGRQRQLSRRASHRRRAAAAATGARVRAPRRPPGAGRHDGAAARAPRGRSPQPGLGGTGGYRVRTHPSCLSLLSPPLPARVPFRKRSGMRSPAASQPGQRFLRRPGSSSRAARSAFVRSAGALPRGASGDGPSRTVSALHPLPNFALHSRVRRLGERRRRGRAVSGWRREETGLTS